MPDSTTLLVVDAALKNMTRSGHFSICVIDKIIELTKVVPDKQAYNTLRLLHCVDFSQMDGELRRKIPALIQSCISGPEFELTVSIGSTVKVLTIDATPEEAPKRRSLWPLRLAN